MIPRRYAPLLWRVLLFVATFILASAGIGLHIMEHGLFWKYGFEWYAGAGKGLIFAAVAFFLLAMRKPLNVRLTTWRLGNLGWLMSAAAAFALGWKTIDELSRYSPSLWLVFAVHLSTIFVVASLLLFCFGILNLRLLTREYRNQLLASASIGIMFTCFVYLIYGLWTVFSSIVLTSVSVLLRFANLHTAYIAPYTLLFSKFAISIAQGCSGIDSMALFTGLYVLIGALDWQRLDHKRFFVLFLPALVVLFCLNILRVFALVLAGYYINPQIAFSLFHTYAGMVFFIIYATIFWTVAYQWLTGRSRVRS